MDVCVIGLGRLGLPLAAALQSQGFEVTGVDQDADRVRLVGLGIAPFHEPGLDYLLPLKATTNLEQAVRLADVIVVIVNTPSLEDGAFSAENVLEVCGRIGAAISESSKYHVVAISSTVMPGTCGGAVRRVIESASGKPMGAGFGLACTPEFVALGNVLHGFLQPDFVLIGADHPRAGEIMARLYERLCTNRPAVARTSLVNAELAKIALNTYLTTKISYANQMTGVCGCIEGADVDEVLGIIALDRRVNGYYLSGGTAYGGPCFPRDDRALLALVERVNAPASFVYHVARFNDAWRRLTVDLVAQLSDHPHQAGRVGILGLAFKPGTDCLTDSTGMALLDGLKERREVRCWDGMVACGQSLRTAQEVVDFADVVALTTPDPAWTELEYRRGQVVVDPWRLLNRLRMAINGVEVVALGVGSCPQLDKMRQKVNRE